MPSYQHAYTASTPDSRSNLDVLDESDIPATSSPGTASRESRGGWRWKWGLKLDPVRGFFKDNTGLLLVAISQAFSAFMNVAVKKLQRVDPPVSTLELVFVRFLITYICGTVYMLYTKVPDPWFGPKDVRLLLLSRGFFGFFGTFGIYYALQYLSLSETTVLTFLAPLCTAIAGSLILKENFTLKQALAGCCSLLGVVLIARPVFIFGDLSPTTPVDGAPMPVESGEKGTPTERLVAVGVAIVAVLGKTAAWVSIRGIGKRAHPLHMMSSFSMLCVIVSSIGMLITREKFVFPTTLAWMGLLVELGTLGFCAQILLTMGLQRETAGRGTMAVYTQIVFATILDRMFFHTIPSALSVTGTLIIIASALYVALTKEKEKKELAVTLENMNEPTLEEGLLSRSPSPETSDRTHRQSRSSAKVEYGEGHPEWAVANDGSVQADQNAQGS